MLRRAIDIAHRLRIIGGMKTINTATKTDALQEFRTFKARAVRRAFATTGTTYKQKHEAAERIGAMWIKSRYGV